MKLLSPIPAAAREKHMAILATSDAGKTVTAKSLVEDWAEAKEQTVIIDPTGVWYGLRTMANGRKGYPFLIFGGANADVPIDASSGVALARLIVEQGLSCIIDLKTMSRMDHRWRLLGDFYETIQSINEAPIHLVIDECHQSMPQTPPRDREGLAQRMTYAANNLVSGGRTAGFQITMISQRAAKVHKDSLTLIQTLIAMQNTSPQDVEAVVSWLKVHAPKDTMQEIMQTLPGLQRGEGWIYSPRIGVLERVKFPLMRTMNTSDAPKHGESRKTPPRLADIDVAAIAELLKSKTAEESAGATGAPKRRPPGAPNGAAAKKDTPPTDDAATKAIHAKALEEAESRGFRNGFIAGRRAERDDIRRAVAGAMDALPAIQEVTAPENALNANDAVLRALPTTARTMMSHLWDHPAGLSDAALSTLMKVKRGDGRWYRNIRSLLDVGFAARSGDLLIPTITPVDRELAL